MQSFLEFLGENKAWWITPLILVLGLVAVLVLQEDGGAEQADEPFVYDLY